jgi:type II secretion system protein C
MSLDSIPKLLANHRLVFAVTLLLMLAAGFNASALVWQLVPQPEIDSDLPQSGQNAAVQTTSGLSTAQKVTFIGSSNLFGEVEQAAPAPQRVTDAPTSSLNYKLRGIYYSDDAALASIILQKGGSKMEFYRLGDEIARNIFVERIQSDHVIIARAGKLEKLLLEKPKLGDVTPVANRDLRSLPGSSQATLLANYRRRYQDNPMALARRFKAIPVDQNGKTIGYKLKALRGERLLRQLNFQQDDVFVAVNGIGLDKPFQALDALKSLTTATSVDVTVLRNGNRETFNLSL